MMINTATTSNIRASSGIPNFHAVVIPVINPAITPPAQRLDNSQLPRGLSRSQPHAYTRASRSPRLVDINVETTRGRSGPRGTRAEDATTSPGGTSGEERAARHTNFNRCTASWRDTSARRPRRINFCRNASSATTGSTGSGNQTSHQSTASTPARRNAWAGAPDPLHIPPSPTPDRSTVQPPTASSRRCACRETVMSPTGVNVGMTSTTVPRNAIRISRRETPDAPTA